MWCDQDISWLDIILWDLMDFPSLSLSHRLWYWWSTLANACTESKGGSTARRLGVAIDSSQGFRFQHFGISWSWRTENWITTTTYPSKSILKRLWSVSRTQTYSIKHRCCTYISPSLRSPSGLFHHRRKAHFGLPDGVKKKKLPAIQHFMDFHGTVDQKFTWLLLRHHNTAKFIGKMVVPLGWGPLIINPIYTLCHVDIYRVYHETSKYQ